MTEAEIQSDILAYLRLRGYFCWNNETKGAIGRGGVRVKNPRKGSPDIEALKNGTYYGIEVKKPKGGRVSEDQKAWLQKITDHGGVAIVTTSLEDLIIRLAGEGKS